MLERNRSPQFQLLHFQLISAALLVTFSNSTSAHRPTQKQRAEPKIEKNILLRIIATEDQRRWDASVSSLLSDNNSLVRRRAALAAGRIGDEEAIGSLIKLLEEDPGEEVRATAAFALGEIESAKAADALVTELKKEHESSAVRGRAVEALGKIAGALPKSEESRAQSLGATILSVLEFENRRRSMPDRQVILLGLTATLRAKPPNAGAAIAPFCSYADPRIRADAANALARLRAKDAEVLRKVLTTDEESIVRANAARVLGATEDKESFAPLLDRAIKDTDVRVRVSSIRALAALKDSRAVDPLLNRGTILLASSNSPLSAETNEILEITVALGRMLQGSENRVALAWLKRARERFNGSAPEVEIAIARISPFEYLKDLGQDHGATQNAQRIFMLDWRAGSSLTQALGEMATLPDLKILTRPTLAENVLQAMFDYRNSGIKINTLVAVHPEYAVPDILRALAGFKGTDLDNFLQVELNEPDPIVRGTAADLLAERPASEATTDALVRALPVALQDIGLNDAALSMGL